MVNVIEIFDFDNTLFRSPVPNREMWSRNVYKHLRKHWWGFLPTLSPPYVPPEPNMEWYNVEILKRALISMDEPNTLTVIATGRRENKGFREPISQILRSAGLGDVVEEHLYLKPSSEMTTIDFKLDLIRGFIQDHQPQRIVVWEDREHHTQLFEKFFQEESIPFQVHHVKEGDSHFPSYMELEIGNLLITD